jgi:hypothetical protein
MPNQLANRIEMAVECRQRNLMLDTERRDPQIVLGNRFARLFQAKPEPRINGGRRSRDIQNAASGDEHFDFGKILGDPPGIESAVSQFADDGNRKQELFDGLGKKRASLASKHGNCNARV